ncbi:hypothetical protein L3X38_028669 [Prunus dulcis]|uniref:Reverse transcriptase domain-containing protein n=1 Tax=Prunus dulcis TaxID=3755 RepID=A0AAD4Z0M9_PRUDU|nr:hypothetical protein L3X38_028669 [Prunus dulcis]
MELIIVYIQGKTRKYLRYVRAAGPLTAVLSGTTFVKIFNPSSISLVGDIPQGLPSFSIPRAFGYATSLIPTALLITGVAILESVGIAKALAAKNGYELDSNQELFGLGVANIFGSFFSAYPTTGSFSRSAVNHESGAKSGLSGLVMGVLMGCALLFMTPLFEYIPQDQVEGIRPEVSPEEGWKPEEDAELVPLDPDKPERKARIGSRLSHEEKIELAAFLRNNKDVFAWSPSDMPGINPQIICHRLHVNPAIKPVAQKRRNFAPERVAIIEAEIDKLLAAGFIQEISYAEWLAKVVLVAKKDKGLWRVCVDYTNLNKACPKDNFPLPRIDQLVDSTSGNQLLSFMDAYSGYNQIMMHKDDKAKTSFIIERGTYCYKVMPFGLKNAGATYQRLVNKIFKEQIGKTMEVYVDDMLVKAPARADHIKNLAEAFSLLRKYNMKLNPSKCTFGVSSGRFLGYLVTQRGIEAHPNQIKAILNMKSPATTKEIQSLTGRAAALNRFLSRSTDKCRPFFKALKKGHRDKWDDECEVAFQNLKTYLTSPPLLSKPIPGEDLYIYLAVSDSAVSSALIREELGAQHPVFYTSKALLDAETRYPKMEKLIF